MFRLTEDLPFVVNIMPFVGAARALLQVFRSLAAVCSPSIVAFDFGFSDRSFSATLCEKDNPERKPPGGAVSGAGGSLAGQVSRLV